MYGVAKNGSSAEHESFTDPQEPIHFKELPNQNIIKVLMDRQTLCTPSTNVMLHRQRAVYQSVVPNCTELDVHTPLCYIRKFTPDGNNLIAISSDQRNVLVYAFMGSGAGQQLYHKNLPLSERKLKLFDTFFLPRHDIPVIQDNGEHLNRECSLFTVDNRYVIVVSTRTLPDTSLNEVYESIRNNEYVFSNENCPLEHSTLYMVDLLSGRVADSHSFKHDFIHFSHNQGISLYNDTLAVLSVLHQTIHIFKVTPGGLFVYERAIGRFCYPDDELVFNEVVSSEAPFTEKTFSSLRHRLMTYLYRQALKLYKEGNKNTLSDFYYKYDYFKRLRIWKMQLIDEKHLMLKYTNEAIVTLQMAASISHPSLFVFYNFETTEIISVYENTSNELLKFYEDYADHFRNTSSRPDGFYQLNCSTACSSHARLIHDRFKQTITNAKMGGPLEAVKRLLGQLPISSQSFSPSPYLDLALFSYDDKWVSSLERPKLSAEQPIR